MIRMSRVRRGHILSYFHITIPSWISIHPMSTFVLSRDLLSTVCRDIPDPAVFLAPAQERSVITAPVNLAQHQVHSCFAQFTMERIKRFIRPLAQSYEPLPEQSGTTQERRRDGDGSAKREASTFEYVVFALVGVAMYVFLPIA